ncbi:MAG: N-acetylglucosamine-6-phosphate deacetylase [Ruminococcaceae bacterium]|nr:N-acetylglucosamine-6-phosphate deacetylase [Oscillospiraceae bacterium]
MILKNAMVMDEDFRLRRLDIRILEDKIAELGENLLGDSITDMTGKYILPGFIDTHIHGAAGVSAKKTEPDLNPMTRFEATQGVTALAITTGSSDLASTKKQLERIKTLSKTCKGSKIIAIHAEGPFINPERKGAIKADNILLPDIQTLDALLDASGGLIKIITLAPEMKGATEFIRYAVSKGITVSLGHTNATYEETKTAIEAGATQITHTFNAMRAINHRNPGILGAAFEDERIVCEMICDYVHLHPAIIRMIYQIKGADKINIVSDSGDSTGLNISEYELEGVKRYIKDGVVRLADGTIAGSAMTVKDGVRNLLSAGFPIEDVSKMASYNPAKSLHAEDSVGSIAIGKYADFVILNQDYDVEATFINGVCVYKR